MMYLHIAQHPERLRDRCLAQGHIARGNRGELAPLQPPAHLCVGWSTLDSELPPSSPKILEQITEQIRMSLQCFGSSVRQWVSD